MKNKELFIFLKSLIYSLSNVKLGSFILINLICTLALTKNIDTNGYTLASSGCFNIFDLSRKEVYGKLKDGFLSNLGKDFNPLREIGNYGNINPIGNTLNYIQFTKIVKCELCPSRSIVYENDKASLMDMESGNILIPFSDEYSQIIELDTNSYIGIKNKLVVFINLGNLNKEVIGEWNELGLFSFASKIIDELYCIYWYSTKMERVVINKRGQKLSINSYIVSDVNSTKSYFITNTPDSSFVIDYNGNKYFSMASSDATFVSDTVVTWVKNKQYNFTNIKSKYILKPLLDYIKVNDTLIICKNGKKNWGAINMNLKTIVPFEYNYIWFFGTENLYLGLYKRQELIIRSLSNKVIFQGSAEVGPSFGNYVILILKKNRYALYNVKAEKFVLVDYDFIEFVNPVLIRYSNNGAQGDYNIEFK